MELQKLKLKVNKGLLLGLDIKLRRARLSHLVVPQFLCNSCQYSVKENRSYYHKGKSTKTNAKLNTGPMQQNVEEKHNEQCKDEQLRSW
jgi:hypothetical protein